ncbi:MAG: hypothetical protein MJ105_02160 [Lachnospiraceae bacterium]|nr:hypothetical protein [Lachnospiraceae bacterium]
MRTKLGISAGLLAAIMYWCGFFSGIVPLIIIAGYVFLKEENDFLKRTALKAVVFLLAFFVIKELLVIIPVMIGDVLDIVNTYSGNYYSLNKVTQVFYTIRDIVGWAQTFFFVFVGFASLKLKDIPFAPLDKIVDSNILHNNQ